MFNSTNITLNTINDRKTISLLIKQLIKENETVVLSNSAMKITFTKEQSKNKFQELLLAIDINQINVSTLQIGMENSEEKYVIDLTKEQNDLLTAFFSEYENEEKIMPIVQIIINSEKKQEFINFCKKLRYNPYHNQFIYMKIIEDKLRSLLPEELILNLKKLSETGDPGIILIKGLPIDEEIPKSDSIQERRNKKGNVSESSIIGLTSIMDCRLDSSPHEQEGRPIHDVSPVKGHETKVSSKSLEPFFLHTENAYLKNPPEFLILLGLEGDNTAKTSYFFVDDLISEIPSEIIEIMKKPEFEIFSGDGADKVESIKAPLISYNPEKNLYQVRLYQNDSKQKNGHRIKPLTDEAKKALSFLSEKFSEEKFEQGQIQGVSLQPGEAIIFSNGWGINSPKGIMHGRGGKISNPNRWLQRGFLFHLNHEDKVSLSENYFKGLSAVMKEGQFTFKESTSVLRTAILDSGDAKAYKKDFPNATPAQIALQSVNYLDKFSKLPKQNYLGHDKKEHSWLKRITHQTFFSPATQSNNNSKKEISISKQEVVENESKKDAYTNRAIFEKLTEKLKSKNIAYRIINHEAEGHSEKIAKIRGTLLQQGAKALVVCCRNKKETQYILAIIPADKSLDIKKIKDYTKCKDVSIAKSEDAEKITGCKIGAIPPFSFNQNLTLLVDPSLIERNEEIVFNAASLTTSIVMRSKDYIAICNGTSFPLIKDEEHTKIMSMKM